jgi:4-hydroxy-tetrahydrodipicolinate synthase
VEFAASQTRRSSWLTVTPVSPFTDDGGALDDARLANLVGNFLDDGIDHLVPNGNTGEYHALTAEERRRALETTIAAASGRARVILAGVGGSIPDAASAAEHAASRTGSPTRSMLRHVSRSATSRPAPAVHLDP